MLRTTTRVSSPNVFICEIPLLYSRMLPCSPLVGTRAVWVLRRVPPQSRREPINTVGACRKAMPDTPPARYRGRALAMWRFRGRWVLGARSLPQPQLRDQGFSRSARPSRGVLQLLVLRVARLQGLFRTAYAPGWAEDRDHGRRKALSWLFAR